MNLFLIGATDDVGGYGKLGGMPWPKASEDLLHFRSLTASGKKTALIVGMRTAIALASLPAFDLSNRVVITVSKLSSSRPALFGERSFYEVATYDDALRLAEGLKYSDVFFAGGMASWSYGLNVAQVAYVTKFHGVFESDATLPTSLYAFALAHGFTEQTRLHRAATPSHPEYTRYVLTRQ